jgi:hypothetical protein
MIFLWSGRNLEHLEKHDVQPSEAVEVVESAQPPDPTLVGDDKRGVWQRTSRGRLLQVIYAYVRLEDVEPEEFERLQFHERIELVEGLKLCASFMRVI